jgi:FlaA1/EpsC-like NDP-sugar epimerase
MRFERRKIQDNAAGCGAGAAKLQMEWTGKKVLVTGACGTIGREIVDQLAKTAVSEIRGLDNNETELFFLREAFRNDGRVRTALGDVRDSRRVTDLAEGADIILHSAALKHVILCEETPSDAIQTNVIGTQNVIEAAFRCGVGRVIFTSSDKAVNPTNVMGSTKLVGERLMTAADFKSAGKGPVFATVRFGNVLGSRGSVVPIFRRQIAAGGPVTITDASMTRFVMSIEDAVSHVISSAELAVGGEVFVMKMPSIAIADLAAVMSEVLSPGREVPIEVIGSKPGEKLYEELTTEEEVRRTIEIDEFLVVTPALKRIDSDPAYGYLRRKGALAAVRPYRSVSERLLSRAELKQMLLRFNLLGAELG